MRRLTAGLALAAAMTAGVASPLSAANVRIGLGGDFESMEPYTLFQSGSIFFLSNIYDALVRFNEHTRIEPSLAVSWEIVEPTLYRFKLREGVRFHNGDEFSADDVVFSYQRALGEGALVGWAVHSIADVRKVDSHTVDIELKYPNIALLNEISNIYIMSARWAEANNATRPVDHRKGEEGATTRMAVGTGPFLLERRDPGVVTVLTPNPDWWDEPRHNLTRAEFRPISSDATRVAALLSGELDLIDPVPLQDIARVTAAPNITLMQAPSVRSVFLGLNQGTDELHSGGPQGSNPFKDRRVRLAMYQAIHVDAIRDRVMMGASTPTATLIAPGIAGHDGSIQRYPYDPDAARALLAEAGYGSGFQVTLDCPNDSEAVNDEQICQALVPMLARIGITVDLEIHPQTRFQDKVLRGASDLYLLNIGSANVKDGSSIVNLAMRQRVEGSRAGWFNPGGYANARVEEIAQVVNATFVPEERQALFSEVLTLVHDDVGVLPIHQQNVVWGVRSNVSVPQTPDNYLRLWLVRVD